MNEYLLQRLKGIQQTLIAQRTGGVGMPNAVVGSERETFLRDFLQKVFPAHRRFSSGAITDSTGAISGQIDIAVEYGEIPSFPLPTSSERLLLAESIAVVIEVKSDLSAQWDQVMATTEKIKKLVRDLNVMMFFGPTIGSTIPVVAVGYTGYATVEALEKKLLETPEASRPTAALVIDSGCFAGYDMKTSGPLGLYALCTMLNIELGRVGFARPDLLNYVRKAPSSTSEKPKEDSTK